MDYDDAIRQYGIDKPDLRLPAFTDVRDCFAAADLETLAINKELPVIAIRIPNVGELSRKERDDIKPLFISKGGARLFEDFKRIENKFAEAAAKVRQKSGAQPNDLLVLVVGSAQSGKDDHPASKRKVTPAEAAIYASAGLLRIALAQKYADRHCIFKKTGDPAKDYRFLWVTNFPMFEYDETDRRWMAAHHPFTSPHDEDMDKLETDPAMVRALAYDVVLNGTELGSGSIRIHRQDVQSRIFQRARHDERRGAVSLRLLPRSAGVWHASTRRHRAGPRSHRDDPGRRRQPARSNPLPQNRRCQRFDGGSPDTSSGRAVAGVGDWCGDKEVGPST